MDRKVLAVLTDEDAEKLIELYSQEDALKELFNNLVNRTTEQRKKINEFWEAIYKKYNIEPYAIKWGFNRMTKEIYPVE